MDEIKRRGTWSGVVFWRTQRRGDGASGGSCCTMAGSGKLDCLMEGVGKMIN